MGRFSKSKSFTTYLKLQKLQVESGFIKILSIDQLLGHTRLNYQENISDLTTIETMPLSRNPQVPWQQEAVIRHSLQLVHSFQHWTGHTLIDTNGSTILVAQRLFEASFVLVSHGTESDPIFNYGNRKLWQLEWEAFTNLPSRCSAEPIEQKERERMLVSTKNQGLISEYQGIRISSMGKRFRIDDGIIWNVLDEELRPCGQAATFNRWTPIT